MERPHLMIVIEDFGIGIRREEIDKVFERFYRGGDELTRKVKGSGLGLTLVKQRKPTNRSVAGTLVLE